jgi:hypothetical protein
MNDLVDDYLKRNNLKLEDVMGNLTVKDVVTSIQNQMKNDNKDSNETKKKDSDSKKKSRKPKIIKVIKRTGGAYHHKR